jgi:type II secretory ATPase GspE/PulE/Tfp pilus assembly ATPase PilB-like protein
MVYVCPALLAQLPESTMYVHPVKLAAVAVAFTLWAMFAQWVDKDTIAVNTFRVLWNLIVLGVGVASAVALLLVPVFAIGYSVFCVANLTLFIVYVVHRNKLVKEEDRVFTMGHLKRLQEQGFSGKKKKPKEVKERVRITSSSRKVVPIPPEDPEREQYRVTQDLLFNTLWRRAAVVEVAPASAEAMKVSYLIDGVSTDGETVPRADGDGLVQFIKQIAGLNLEERRKPQKGQFMAAIGDHKHKLMARTDGSTAGEKLTLRVIYNEADYKVPDLGFNPKQLDLAMQTKNEDARGLVLLSAPPASGLTTTIYSFTRNHDRFLQNVQLIEFEKELDIDNVTQIIYAPGDTMSFAERLLRIVRADPDIIVLPEVRDREVAAVASKAASEKQKVYVAMQALDNADALRKWLALVGDKALVAKSLFALCNQRLVRKLCETCKQAYKPDAQMMRKLNLPEDKVLFRVPEAQVDKHGNPIICPACQGTGYIGRTGVFEWIPVDDSLREAIRNFSSPSELQGHIAKKGGIGLQGQALQKVLDGVTSIQEVARVMRGEAPPKSAASRAAPPAKAAAPQPQPKPAVGGAAQPKAGGK